MSSSFSLKHLAILHINLKTKKKKNFGYQHLDLNVLIVSYGLAHVVQKMTMKQINKKIQTFSNIMCDYKV